MQNQVHSNYWHMLAGRQIADLFDTNFEDVTCKPSYDIGMQLKSLEVATLQLIENRTESTIYRIFETGVVYQVCQPEGAHFEFEDYESYQLEESFDRLIKIYIQDDPDHRIVEQDGKIYIDRLKSPAFKGCYSPENPLNSIEILEWVDQMPETVSELSYILRRAGRFLSKYLEK
jgi:hypothetical protein